MTHAQTGGSPAARRRSPRARSSAFAAAKRDLVLGGTFADLPLAQRRQAAARERCASIPPRACSGWSQSMPGAASTTPELRRLLEPGDRSRRAGRRARRPGTRAARDLARARASTAPPRRQLRRGLATPLRHERAAGAARRRRARLFGSAAKPTIRVALPEGPGADLLLRQSCSRDWGALGFAVERAAHRRQPPISRWSTRSRHPRSPAWFVRQFRCEATPVCDADGRHADGRRRVNRRSRRNATRCWPRLRP